MIQGQSYEFHLTILNVKMRVKFPCRMKIEHQGSLLTSEASPSQDHRYLFNQSVSLKDPSQKEYFQLTVNLITDKGAKYIAGVLKLYQSELVRSEGERLVLSLSKCIDTEAFCEVKVDRVQMHRSSKSIPHDRKSAIHREVHVRHLDTNEMDFSPHRSAHNVRIQESKSQYQVPLHNNRKAMRQDWDTKSKSRFKPPQTVYQKSRVAHRLHYGNGNQGQNIQVGQMAAYQREKLLQAQVYKQGYHKLKQKYKKEAEVSKQQLNKRLALQNTENNLKLEVLRLKLKGEQQQRIINDKNNKLKQNLMQLVNLQQKESEGAYLREQNEKRESTIRLLEDKIRGLTRNLEELKDISDDRSAVEGTKLKELQFENSNLRIRFQAKEKQMEKQNKTRLQTLHEKQLQLVSKTDSLQREKKTVGDLERAIQNKHFQMQKLLQNQRNNAKTRLQEQKVKIDRQQRQMSRLQDQKKQLSRQFQQMKNSIVKSDYDKKLLVQQLQALKIESTEMKAFKDKYLQQSRQNRSIAEEKSHMERQLERTIQNKDSSISEISKQFQDQLQYYKRINRDQDEKAKQLSNKVMELESHLDLSRGQQDKIRRNYESSIKQAVDAKQKEKAIKKDLKNKQQEMLTMQTQQATLKQKLKSIDQISKLQVDKQREENEKIRIQLENQIDKNQELLDSNNQMSMELNKLKIKMQYADDRAEKDGTNLRDKQNQVEGLIKDYEEQMAGLDQTINTLRLSDKELSTRLQKTEMELIKSQQKCQRTRKDLRVLQEKFNSTDGALKLRNVQLQGVQGEKESLEQKCSELQIELNELKNENVGLTSEKNKFVKMIQLLQAEVKKAKGDNSGLGSAMSEKEKEVEELRNALKEEKDQFVRQDLKFNNFKKEIQRHKELLFDIIQKSLFTLPLGTKEDGKKSIELILNRKPVENNFSQYFTMISSHAKEVKQALVKQTDLISQLEREKQRLQEEVASSSSKYHSTQHTLKRQMEELELSLQNAVEERQTDLVNHGEAMQMFEERIKQFEMVVEELNNQIQELNFTNNSLKMDFDVINQQNTKKIANLKKLNTEFQEKVQYNLIVIAELDEKCNVLEGNADNMQTTIHNEGEANTRKDKLLQEFKETTDSQGRTIEELKKGRKDLMQRVSELELYLNTEKEINQKNRQIISEEESKSNELKVFISNIMKQKEAAIKAQLQRSEAIMSLQTTLHEVSKDLELLTEQNARNAKNLQTQKELNKKLQISIKEVQNDKKEQKQRYQKASDLLRQREKEIVNKDDLIKRHQLKYQRMIDKFKAEVKELQEEVDLKSHLNLEQTKQSSDRVFNLESQLQKKSGALSNIQTKLHETEQAFFVEKEKGIQNEETIKRLQTEVEELKMKKHEMEATVNDMSQEIKAKQEQLYEYSGRSYSLEQKVDSLQRDYAQQLQMYGYQWTEKYDSMCQEFEQRFELTQKEKDYFKSLSQEKDRQISKLHSAIRQSQSNEASTRKLYEEKLKKIEENKLSLLSGKNVEVHRLEEDTKTLCETLKVKQNEFRKVTNQLEVARKTITNLDLKSREYDDKFKGVNRLYQTELQQLKKRDQAFKNHKESMNNYLWNTERQIKKGIQNFIKNFLQVSEDKNSQKIVELARVLQKSIMDIMAVRPIEK